MFLPCPLFFKLAVDAVWKQSDEVGGGSRSFPSSVENITDTQIFSLVDLLQRQQLSMKDLHNFSFQANSWDANGMFKFNQEAYGIKSTYDSRPGWAWLGRFCQPVFSQSAPCCQVKDSTLNPNRKEFVPVKGNAALVR